MQYIIRAFSALPDYRWSSIFGFGGLDSAELNSEPEAGKPTWVRWEAHGNRSECLYCGDSLTTELSRSDLSPQTVRRKYDYDTKTQLTKKTPEQVGCDESQWRKGVTTGRHPIWPDRVWRKECDTKNNRHVFSCGGFCNMIYYV